MGRIVVGWLGMGIVSGCLVEFDKVGPTVAVPGILVGLLMVAWAVRVRVHQDAKKEQASIQASATVGRIFFFVGLAGMLGSIGAFVQRGPAMGFAALAMCTLPFLIGLYLVRSSDTRWLKLRLRAGDLDGDESPVGDTPINKSVLFLVGGAGAIIAAISAAVEGHYGPATTLVPLGITLIVHGLR